MKAAFRLLLVGIMFLMAGRVMAHDGCDFELPRLRNGRNWVRFEIRITGADTIVMPACFQRIKGNDYWLEFGENIGDTILMPLYFMERKPIEVHGNAYIIEGKRTVMQIPPGENIQVRFGRKLYEDRGRTFVVEIEGCGRKSMDISHRTTQADAAQ